MSTTWTDQRMASAPARFGFVAALWQGRGKYLAGAVLIALSLILAVFILLFTLVPMVLTRRSHA